MTPEQIREFMERNRFQYDCLVRAGYVKQLDYATREGLLRVAKEFSPAYNANLWCSECVIELLHRAYEWYDAWKIRNPA